MHPSIAPVKSATRFIQSQNVSHTIPLFTFDGFDVRVIAIDGEPWFVAKDIAEVLGYTNTRKAVRDHCKAAKPVGGNDSFLLLDPQTIVIPERDMYRLVLKSQLPAAERFEEWVVSEVLPSIRKTGGYAAPAALPSYAETLRLYADQIEQTAVLQIANIQQAKKIESLEHLFMAGETPSQFVKRLNGVNAQKINATLLELGWIYNAESEPDRSPKYRTTSKARSQLLLTERPRKIDGEGFDKPLIRYDLQMLESGATKLHNLYLDLRLTMKKTWDQQFFYAKFAEEASQ